jgi:adenylate cyclase class IV
VLIPPTEHPVKNVELKAELREPQLAVALVRRLGASRIGIIHQVDTYFRVPDCRLKKRQAQLDGHAEPVEWIRYERPDRTQPKVSNFRIYSEAEAIKRFGSAPLPVRVVVDKTRDLWMIDAVRIHLDDVAGLGRFLEVEVLVTPRQNVARSHARLAQIRRHLAPVLGEPIACSYSDMLEPEPGPSTR